MHAAGSAPPTTRAGVVVRSSGELRFLCGHVVRRFVPRPPLSDVSGTGLTMALVDGQVLAVIAAGQRGTTLTVCEVGGELVGLLGAEPESVGIFDSDGDAVYFRGQRVAVLDVAELVRLSARGADQQLPEAEA